MIHIHCAARELVRDGLILHEFLSLYSPRDRLVLNEIWPKRASSWSALPLSYRLLLVVSYWRTNLTLCQLVPLFGISKSAADRIIDDLAEVGLASAQTIHQETRADRGRHAGAHAGPVDRRAEQELPVRSLS